MGNRAIITDKSRQAGIYLHWNGGRDSVEAFLEYCRLQGYRGFADDYGKARFCQVVGNFFGGSNSLGVSEYTKDVDMDPGDNGIYVVEGWDIVERLTTKYNADWKPIGTISYPESSEQREYDLQEMLIAIDESMPKKCQLGQDYIKAAIVDASELKIGDKVYKRQFDDTPDVFEVVAIKDGVPYVNMYDHDGDWTWNQNNAIRGSIRIAERGKNE